MLAKGRLLGVQFAELMQDGLCEAILPDAHLAVLKDSFGFAYQQRVDEMYSAVRFCTSWATKAENVEALIAAIEKL